MNTAMSTIETDEKIIKIVLQSLPEGDLPTAELIRITVRNVVELLRKLNQITGAEIIDEDQLVKKIETLCNVYVPAMSTLDDMRGHQEWFFSRRASIQWRFWDRYKRYLENDPEMPPQAVRRLDDVTNQILSRLEDPSRLGAWDRRGMVVGQVQSGKTANYIGLICKAADAGYKLIVVLAGIHNSLRSQTQLRVDEGFLGFDTQYQQRYDDRGTSYLGVGAMPGATRLKVASLTNSAEAGDFKRAVAVNTSIPIGDYPVVLVIKKHRSILNYLRKWVVEVEGRPTGRGNRKIVHDVPVLVIDDEADNASV